MKTHSTSEPGKAAGTRISSLLAEYKDIPVLLMLSGGSAFSVLEYVDFGEINNVSLTLIDERFVLSGHGSNTTELQGLAWYLKYKDIEFINPQPLINETLVDAAVRFENGLRLWSEQNSGGKVIALLGIGPDGHTAGILPMPNDQDKFNEIFVKSNKWLAGYTHPTTSNLYKERITVTAKFLKEQVDNAVVYAVGDNKCQVINTLGDNTQLYTKPANILVQMQKVDIYTDCDINQKII